MNRLCKIAPSDRVSLHENVGVRIYSRLQSRRLRHTRLYVREAIQLFDGFPTLVDLGCGALDLYGGFSNIADIYGVECNEKYIPVVKERHPDCKLIIGDVESFTPKKVDILVLCEILEHIVDPKSLVRRLLPMAKYAIISHPIDEELMPDRDFPESEHYWSFSFEDFKNWFYENNYEILRYGPFDNHGFNLQIGIGRNKNAF